MWVEIILDSGSILQLILWVAQYCDGWGEAAWYYVEGTQLVCVTVAINHSANSSSNSQSSKMFVGSATNAARKDAKTWFDILNFSPQH